LKQDRLLIGLIKSNSVRSAINEAGKNSIAYMITRLRGKNLLGDLTGNELNTLAPFIDRYLLNFLKDNINLAGAGVGPSDKEIMYINYIPKSLSSITAKRIRLERADRDPLCVLKTGTILTPREAINYFHNISRLTAVKHRNILLRIHHGDIYTKARLFRFGLTDSPLCPRCNSPETIEHKFVTCAYSKRIWRELDNKTGFISPVPDSIQDRLLANAQLDPLKLLIHSEILHRIAQLKPDANYLIRPKNFVENTLKYLTLMEKNSQMKNELNDLL